MKKHFAFLFAATLLSLSALAQTTNCHNHSAFVPVSLITFPQLLISDAIQSRN